MGQEGEEQKGGEERGKELQPITKTIVSLHKYTCLLLGLYCHDMQQIYFQGC